MSGTRTTADAVLPQMISLTSLISYCKVLSLSTKLMATKTTNISQSLSTNMTNKGEVAVDVNQID